MKTAKHHRPLTQALAFGLFTLFATVTCTAGADADYTDPTDPTDAWITQAGTSSIPLDGDNWNSYGQDAYTYGPTPPFHQDVVVVEEPDGLKVYGPTHYRGFAISFSETTADFSNATIYFKWMANSSAYSVIKTHTRTLSEERQSLVQDANLVFGHGDNYAGSSSWVKLGEARYVVASPATSPDVSLSSTAFRVITAAGQEIANPSPGETVNLEVTVTNNGDARDFGSD